MIHICTDCWTEGVSEMVHEVAQESNLHPPDHLHPLIQIRDTARKWLGLGVELLAWDLDITDRHNYLTKASNALMVLHAGDMSSPLYRENGGMCRPHPTTGAFGMPATYAWNVAFERRLPRVAFNILSTSPQEAGRWIKERLDEHRNPYNLSAFRLAITGPTEKYKAAKMLNWTRELFSIFAEQADPSHAMKPGEENPLLLRILEDEDEARRAFGMPKRGLSATVAVTPPVGLGKPRPGKPKKTPVAVIVAIEASVPAPHHTPSVGKTSVGKKQRPNTSNSIDPVKGLGKSKPLGKKKHRMKGL